MNNHTGPVPQQHPLARGVGQQVPSRYACPDGRHRTADIDPVTVVSAALFRVERLLPDLQEALRPGTRHGPAVRMQRRRAGNSGPAPLRISVLDALTDIETGVTTVLETVCARLGTPACLTRSLTERLRRLVFLLQTEGEQLLREDPDLLAFAIDEITRLATRGTRVLDGGEPVQRLSIRCPVCGALSLRCFPERSLVVCVNASCQCDNPACGCVRTRPRRHHWDMSQWADITAFSSLVEK